MCIIKEDLNIVGKIVIIVLWYFNCFQCPKFSAIISMHKALHDP